MKHVNIPDIGDIIELGADWTFILYPESRNSKLGAALGYKPAGQYWASAEGERNMKRIHRECSEIAFDHKRYFESIELYNRSYPNQLPNVLTITLGVDTILKVDRVYIRKGAKDFSSLTFFIKSGPYKGARFWAKLNEVNQIFIK